RVNELVEGYVGHEPCHLDDHVSYNGSIINLTGGWHSAGDYGKHDYWGMHIIGVVYSCLFSYESCPDVYDDIDRYDVDGSLVANGVPDILDEAMFGINYIKRLLLPNGSLLGSLVGPLRFVAPEDDTDGIVGNDDDRHLFSGEHHEMANPYEAMWAVASLAKMIYIIDKFGFFNESREELENTALTIYLNYSRLYNYSISMYIPTNGISNLLANYELYRISLNQTYLDRANCIAININKSFYSQFHSGWPFNDELGSWNRVVGFYCWWAYQNGSQSAINMAKNVLNIKWHDHFEPLSSTSENIFHILKMPVENGKIDYFWTRIGLNSYYLTAAFAAFMACNLTGNIDFDLLKFGFDQLSWVLGRNPFETCMVESIGFKNPSIYHHRYAFIPGNPRGAVPGAIINGIIYDENNNPFINENSADGNGIQDMQASASSNEPWLPHNVHFLQALSALKSRLESK
ncbi:MAG: glycoside hydrolase family 9 protein, partial [Promethearchaeota archaeon]